MGLLQVSTPQVKIVRRHRHHNSSKGYISMYRTYSSPMHPSRADHLYRLRVNLTTRYASRAFPHNTADRECIQIRQTPARA
jgi:hypothetical protein